MHEACHLAGQRLPEKSPLGGEKGLIHESSMRSGVPQLAPAVRGADTSSSERNLRPPEKATFQATPQEETECIQAVECFCSGGASGCAQSWACARSTRRLQRLPFDRGRSSEK